MPAQGRDEVVEQVADLFRTVMRRRGPGKPRVLPIHQDLTMGQFRALMVLSRHEPLAISALGDRLGVGVPAASKVVDRLVQAALAERWEDPSDRRRALVRLTAHGRDSMEQVQQGRELRRGMLRDLLGQLSEADLALLHVGMQALAAAAEARSPQDERVEGGPEQHCN